jgi:Skp family chaperone for outer membrane proteins
MNRLKQYGWLLAAMLIPAAAMAQEMKVAVVNTELAVMKSAAGIEANKSLTAKYEEKTKEFDAKKKELDELNDKLKRQGPLMKPEVAEELRRTIDQKSKDFSRALEDTDRELDSLRRTSLDPIIKAMKDELDRLVKERNYDMVFDLAGEIGPAVIVWSSERINITDELVKRVDGVLKVSTAEPKSSPPLADAKIEGR